MQEADAEIVWLQELLDTSHAGAGGHLRSIHTDDRRLSAEAVIDRLQGMVVLVVATVTADGRPLTGPVDGFLFHGRLHYGTGWDEWDPLPVAWRIEPRRMFAGDMTPGA